LVPGDRSLSRVTGSPKQKRNAESSAFLLF